MKRRSFFRSLAALTVAPKIILNAIERLPTLSMVPTSSATEDPFEGFRLATEPFPDEMYMREFDESIWIGLLNKAPYPNGLGESTRIVEHK